MAVFYKFRRYFSKYIRNIAITSVVNKDHKASRSAERILEDLNKQILFFICFEDPEPTQKSTDQSGRIFFSKVFNLRKVFTRLQKSFHLISDSCLLYWYLMESKYKDNEI